MSRTTTPAWLGLAALLLSVGCFTSSTTQGSFDSSSDSSSSVSDSISKSSTSSSPEDEKPAESAFRRDVADYVASAAASGGDAHSLQRDVAAIAEQHGITDWERLDGAYLAIGQGLARSGVGHGRYEQLAVELSNQDFTRLALVRAGYEAQSTQ